MPALNNGKSSLVFLVGKFVVFWVFYCGITCKWVFFPTIDFYFYQLAQIVGKYIIDSFSRAQSRLRQKLNVYVFQLARKWHCCRASSFLTGCLFACAASNRANLVFKTTIIKDTHLKLAGILFKVETNNSLIFLPLQTYKSFRSCSYL